MNAPQLSHPDITPIADTPATNALFEAASERRLHRERDFGIGYGNSSGYASERHYVDGHADPMFSCR